MTFTIGAVVLAALILTTSLTVPFLRRFFVRAISGLCLLFIGKYIGICSFSAIGATLTVFLGVPGTLSYFAISSLLK